MKIWGLNLSCLLPKPAWEEVTVWRPCSFSISSGILRSIPWFSWASRFASPLGILEHLMLVGDPTVPLGWKLLFKSHREDVSQLKREDHAWRSPNSQFCGWDLFLKTFCRISRSAISWSFLTFQMMQAQKCVADWKLMFKTWRPSANDNGKHVGCADQSLSWNHMGLFLNGGTPKTTQNHHF